MRTCLSVGLPVRYWRTRGARRVRPMNVKIDGARRDGLKVGLIKRKHPDDFLYGISEVGQGWFSENKTHVSDYTEHPEELKERLRIERLHDPEVKLAAKPQPKPD